MLLELLLLSMSMKMKIMVVLDTSINQIVIHDNPHPLSLSQRFPCTLHPLIALSHLNLTTHGNDDCWVIADLALNHKESLNFCKIQNVLTEKFQISSISSHLNHRNPSLSNLHAFYFHCPYLMKWPSPLTFDFASSRLSSYCYYLY